MNYDELRSLDLAHLWHPYSDVAALEGARFPIIERAEGAYLYDVDGRAILDGISSWWGVNLGHGHPAIVKAITRQAEKLQHSILGGMSHPGAIALAAKLAEITPEGLTRVFFAGDGASAVEAALKISLQYWANVGRAERNVFVSLADAYHGDTLGAMGVGFVPGFHAPFEKVLTKGLRAASPHCFHCPEGKVRGSCGVECFGSMEGIVRENHERIAAVIIEPLCQGAAGMRIYHPEYLTRLRHLADEFGIILIADEIAVGFGRTGEMFACEHAGISPDIMCLGKGLTGGTLALSATVVTEKLYESFKSDAANDRTFYHGHTYCGNPIASAAANAAIDTYITESVIEKSAPAAAVLADGFKRLSKLECVHDAATLWMIGALEVSEAAGGASLARAAAAKALELGLQVRPLGPVVYLWPPLVTPAELVRKMVAILEESLVWAARS